MKIQSRWTAILSAVLSISLAHAAGAFAVEGHFERTLKVTGPVELDVRAGSGNIEVRTGDASSVRVHGTIRANHSSFFDGDAKKKVRYLEANPPIEQHGDFIKIGHTIDSESQRNVSISYAIVVPVETQLRSGTGSGNQTIEGIAGPLDASTGSGHIKTSNIGSEVRASTGSGGIELQTVKGTVHASTGSGTIRALGVAGGFRASTGSGNVTLEPTVPGDVEVSAGSGSIRLIGVRGGVRVHTASGSITVEGEATETWRLETTSGNISARLPPQTGFNLLVRTVSGSIATNRPLTIQGTFSRRHLSGKAGNGGPLLDFSTVSGNIHVE